MTDWRSLSENLGCLGVHGGQFLCTSFPMNVLKLNYELVWRSILHVFGEYIHNFVSSTKPILVVETKLSCIWHLAI